MKTYSMTSESTDFQRGYRDALNHRIYNPPYPYRWEYGRGWIAGCMQLDRDTNPHEYEGDVT